MEAISGPRSLDGTDPGRSSRTQWHGEVRRGFGNFGYAVFVVLRQGVGSQRSQPLFLFNHGEDSEKLCHHVLIACRHSLCLCLCLR